MCKTDRNLTYSYEKGLLKKDYGSITSRLSQASYRNFDACHLCLSSARDPVACASRGDLFCRSCVLENLLAQRKDIKRQEKAYLQRLQEIAENKEVADMSARELLITEFEMAQAGLSSKTASAIANDIPSTSVKRKFELDDAEVLRIAQREQERAKKILNEMEKNDKTKSKIRAFWIPDLAPEDMRSSLTAKLPKTAPICPASSEGAPHSLNLKGLIDVHFSEYHDGKNEKDQPSRICPACQKALNNSLKSNLLIACGHVICKPCFEKFMAESKSCYVCETSIEGSKAGSLNIVQLRSEGSGYAAGGKTQVTKARVAFQ